MTWSRPLLVWPVLTRSRMAAFEVITEGIATPFCAARRFCRPALQRILAGGAAGERQKSCEDDRCEDQPILGRLAHESVCPSDDRGVQRRREAPSAATPCWAASGRSLDVGLNRPERRWRGPLSASHVARRAASSRTASFGVIPSALSVLAKTKSPFVTVPMIPLIH